MVLQRPPAEVRGTAAVLLFAFLPAVRLGGASALQPTFRWAAGASHRRSTAGCGLPRRCPEGLRETPRHLPRAGAGFPLLPNRRAGHGAVSKPLLRNALPP